MNTPCLPNIEALLAAGLNPKTGLPMKMDSGCSLKDNIKRVLRVIDEQDCVNRFNWINLPYGIDENLVERILYYRGQGVLFFHEPLKKFFFLPFVLNGDIDVYGRYTKVSPLPFNGTSTNKDEKPWIPGKLLTPIYDVMLEVPTLQEFTNNCVILTDYSRQISQKVLPRQVLDDGILDLEADLLPFMRTSLMNQAGVTGMRVNSEDEESNVKAASYSINQAALSGQKYVPIIGQVDFQSLGNESIGQSANFLQAFEAIDNLRLSAIGIENGGVFQKKAHILQTEQAMNQGGIGPVAQDGLKVRQQFCILANSLWGLQMWCEPAESANMLDMNNDGKLYDDKIIENVEVNNDDMQ